MMNPSVFSLRGILVDIDYSHISAAQELASEFHASSSATNIEILAAFIAHCAANPDVAIAAFQHLHKTYCADENIHVVVQQLGLPHEQMRSVLKGYYAVWGILESRDMLPAVPLPALFSEDGVRLVAMFGGQDGTGHYLDEATWMLDVYRPLVSAFVGYISDFAKQASQDSRMCGIYTHPFDLLSWIESPEMRPEASYLALYPVSIVTVAVVQLLHLMVLYKTLRLSPGELLQLFKGAIGHCQGLAFAAMFASLTDENSFYNGAKKAIGILMAASANNWLYTPRDVVRKAVVGDNSLRDGTPSPMAAIRGIALPTLSKLLNEYNMRCTKQAEHVFLAIINGHNDFVVTGRTTAVIGLVALIRKRFADPKDNQSQILLLKRRPVAVINYLPCNLVGHCELLAPSADQVYSCASSNGWQLNSSDMHIAVITGSDAHDLRSEDDATKAVVNGLTIEQINWPAAVTAADATHIIDFSPGGAGVFPRLTRGIVDGKGVAIICASLLAADPRSQFGSISDIYQPRFASIVSASIWQSDFGPRLARTVHDRQLYVDSPLSRLLRLPPIVISCNSAAFIDKSNVAAICNAGFHVELGCNGAFREDAFRSMVESTYKLLEPGNGFAVNLAYVDQKQWLDDFSVFLRLCRDGIPITGLSVSGEVPPAETAGEIIKGLLQFGIRYVAFTPDSVSAIRQCVAIARHHSMYPIVIQLAITHSRSHPLYDEFHQSILEMYGSIRSQRNIVLVVGSRFSDCNEALAYITGEWSLIYGRSHMPADGIFVTPESILSELHAIGDGATERVGDTCDIDSAAPGVPASSEQGYLSLLESATTLDAPIGSSQVTRTYQEVLDQILSASADDHPALTRKHKQQIIDILNAHSPTPWFGTLPDGRVVDLQDMSYSAVMMRLAELLYDESCSCWTDPSHRSLFISFLRRTEDRFSGSMRPRLLQGLSLCMDPLEMAEDIKCCYPAVSDTELVPEDVDYLVHLGEQADFLPVPFVLVIDTDQLSQMAAHHLFTRDDKGLVAATTRDAASIQDALRRMSVMLTDIVHNLSYEDGRSAVPEIEYLGPVVDSVAPLPSTVIGRVHQGAREYTLPLNTEQLPNHELWLEALAGPYRNWLRALITSKFLLRRGLTSKNTVTQALKPMPGQTARVKFDGRYPTSLEICSYKGELDLRITISENNLLTLVIYHRIGSELHEVPLLYRYTPSSPVNLISEILEGRDELHKHLQIASLGAEQQHAVLGEFNISNPLAPIACKPFVVTEAYVRSFCACVRNYSPSYWQKVDEECLAPLDMLFSIAWPGFSGVMATSPLNSGQFGIVHMSNKTSYLDAASPLQAGDVIGTEIQVTAIENIDIGRKVTMQARFSRGGKQLATIESAIVTRGEYAVHDITFRLVDEPVARVHILSLDSLALLESKEWFVYRDVQLTETIHVGQVLEFRLQSLYRFKSDTAYSTITTAGSVCVVQKNGRYIHVADIDYAACDLRGNAVMNYLQRHSTPLESVNTFDHGGFPLEAADVNGHLTLRTPADNWEYSRVSGDFNIIHTNSYLARIVDLPEAICHGMWTSAAVRAIVERAVADGSPSRFRSFQADFVGMVFPNDTLETKLQHVGMRCGNMVIEGMVHNQHGEIVMTCMSEISQPKTAYIFTGQGSQFVGMGMDLYQKSPAARSVWDRADEHMRSTYGVSLLHIVQNNPSQCAVKFYGEKGGAIRSNYLSLARHHDGSSKQLIPAITCSSSEYTHYSETGLLNATLFTQPVMAVLAMAQVADMRSKGLIQENAQFAGHSFGEICSLASIAEMVTIEDAVEIAFIRGLLMHTSVERDTLGRSQYALVSINPAKVGHGFDVASLQGVIDLIREHKNQLLEIVNYNIQGAQYIVAGHVESLEVMGQTLSYLSSQNTRCSYANRISAIHAVVKEQLATPAAKTGLRNGAATTLLQGIDVPFHSTQLNSSIPAFRDVLDQRIPKQPSAFANLYDRFIPNLTGTPFEVTLEFVRKAYDTCNSYLLHELIESWSESILDDIAQTAAYARTILIELLAFQIARPVRWIDTQNTLFIHSAIAKLVEIGPNAALCHMASRTTASWHNVKNEIAIIHATVDRDKVYYLNAPDLPTGLSEDTSSSSGEPSAKEDVPQPISAPVHSSSAQRTPTNPSASQPTYRGLQVVDVPIPVTDILQAVIAVKLRKHTDTIPLSRSIKELVAGKSTLQNEIIGDLVNEFGKVVPEHTAELPLHEVSKRIGDSVDSLGKYTQSIIHRMFASKLPNVFSQSIARSYLKTRYGLGPRRQDAVLLIASTTEPIHRLADEISSQAWLDDVAHTYATTAGISLSLPVDEQPRESTTYQHNNSDSGYLEELKKNQHGFAIRQMQLLADTIGVDIRQGAKEIEDVAAQVLQQAASIDNARKEVGEQFLLKSASIFNGSKARHYNSFWNWVRQDALQWINDALTGKEEPKREFVMQRLHRLKNRSNPGLLKMVQGIISHLGNSSDPRSQIALKIADDIIDGCKEALDKDPVYVDFSTPLAPHVEINERGEIHYTERPRAGEVNMADYVNSMKSRGINNAPLIHICERHNGLSWTYSEPLTTVYFDSLCDIATAGLTFKGKTALVTGCSNSSIGSGLVEGLLSGGARVIATTSSYNMKSIQFFEDMYRNVGARGSELVLVPFNQASVQDVEGLIDYIYSKDGLGVDLDFVLPFASFPEHGKDMTSVDSNSEVTMRILLTNILRMLGRIKLAKIRYTQHIMPTLVVLPHSPNQGLMGNDGLYGETKAALHALYNRWHSESWSGYISLTGGDIGWTRSTNMTSESANSYAEMEKAGWRTFSREEMAFNILGLLCPLMIELAHRSPVFGSFVGLTLPYERLQNVHTGIRADLSMMQSKKRSVLSGIASDTRAEQQVDSNSFQYKELTVPLANYQLDCPKVKTYEQLAHLRYMQDMVDLDKVVVVTGFGEVGSYGNAALRWEMEAYGEFSLEGCVELAWIMGLIKYVSGKLKSADKIYTGWVDSKTEEPVCDMDVKSKYEKHMLEHTGIRPIEPELCANGALAKKPFMRELQIDHDLEPFEATAEEAAHFKLENGDKVDMWANGDGTWSVKLLKGAIILVPKAMKFDRTTVAQIPTGWDPERFGLSQDLIERMDPVNCYSIVAATEALIRSGIADPYEVYQYLHVSEVGHSIGSCMGGGQSRLSVLKWRWMDRQVGAESLVESSINNIGAWINLLLMSSAGPLKPVVAACATSLVAIDTAVETIQSGKARMILAGAANSYEQETSNELAAMNATASSDKEAATGRFSNEISRPCTTTRSGFTEGYGAGIAVLMSASAAIEMGAPIYGVVALSSTATDKCSSNTTAPGQGVLTIAREYPEPTPSPLLDIKLRRRCLQRQLSDIDAMSKESVGTPWELAKNDVSRLKKAAQCSWGNDFYRNNPSISPLRGALAVWGLGPDDIGLASFHGTSTTLNDLNESDVYCKLMKQLGRTPGFPVPVVCQKWLTGHPKSAAALFMLNGVLQSMHTSIIPGNRNADNIDNGFEQYDYLVYPNQTYKVPMIKAAMLTSFGMSQSGASALVVHPDYLLATLPREALDAYRIENMKRMKKAHRRRLDSLYGKHPFVQVKTLPPYTPDQETRIYLNPHERAKYNPETSTYHF